VKKEIDMNRDCHDDECGAIPNERLRYFTGRHMTARDFEREQDYHRSFRLLHNRMLHGWGVVCGLHVVEHPTEKCRVDHVKVRCGFALDCCGREIPVQKDSVPPPIPWGERKDVDDTESDADADSNSEAYRPPPRWYPMLCLEYRERGTERVPVLYSEQQCDPQRREDSRIREGYELRWHWVLESQLSEYHWKTRGGGCPCPEEDCGDAPDRCCLDPQCPPHHCVPLAVIRVRRGQPIRNEDIDTLGRPTPEASAGALTHICDINWPHGGVVSRRQLEEMGELRVRFDRRLRRRGRSSYGPDGVNAATFVVQYGGRFREDLDFVDSTRPPYLRKGCVAIYPINPRGSRHHDERPYAYLEGQVVFVAMKCDFVLDEDEVPVDGNFLRGVLPTGDGVAGGLFESWFRVVPDHDYERCLQEQRAEEQRTDEQRGEEQQS
jgi:hypothetical protein